MKKISRRATTAFLGDYLVPSLEADYIASIEWTDFDYIGYMGGGVNLVPP